MNRHIPHRFRPPLAIIAALSAGFAGISQAGPNIHPKPSLAIDGGHVVVNDDDANGNQEWDKNENPTPDKGLSGPKTPEQLEPKLQKFTFTAKHTSEPGTLVITASSNANIKLWEDAAKTSPFTAASSYPVGISDDVTVTFYVEGLTPTAAFDSIVFSASFTVAQKTAVGEIKFGVTQADIDIDSDNNAGLTATFTDEDDKREFSDKTEHPGKILLETTAAIDANGVAASVMQSAFAPLRVTLHPPFSPGTAKVKFTYPASVPSPSAPANKRGLRLWKVNGNGSVFIAPGGELPWNDIAVSGATDATLYVEYVEIPGSTKTYSKEDILITVTDPEGAGKGHIKILGNTTPLTGKESPDGLCVSLLPVDITVVFGEGPGGFTPEGGMTSKQNLENFLETVKVAEIGNTWAAKGKDNHLFGIEIGTDEVILLRALSKSGHTVIFDGHANFGFGPNFSKATNKTIDSFTNFGAGATDIPVTYRGDGTMEDVLPYYPGSPPANIPDVQLGKILVALDHMVSEGWSYVVPAAADIKGTVTNLPVPNMPGRWKFESAHGVSAGTPLDIQGSGIGEYHFISDPGQSKRVIVSAPGNEVPPLHYKTFFYNACSSGPHFIEKFPHGEFIYTNRLCAVFESTRLFVKGLIEKKTTAEILQVLEDENADGDGNENNTTYEVKDF